METGLDSSPALRDITSPDPEKRRAGARKRSVVARIANALTWGLRGLAAVIALLAVALLIYASWPQVWPFSKRCHYISDQGAVRRVEAHIRDKFEERFGNFYPGKSFDDVALKVARRGQDTTSYQDKDGRPKTRIEPFILLDLVDKASGARLGGFTLGANCWLYMTREPREP
jgi:hypothetical protein